MRGKRMKIQYLVNNLEIVGFGITKKGKQVEVPDNIGKQLCEEGLAKEVKGGKIKTDVKDVKEVNE